MKGEPSKIVPKNGINMVFFFFGSSKTLYIVFPNALTTL